MSKIKELQDELKTVFAGRGVKILDVIVPLAAVSGFQTIIWFDPSFRRIHWIGFDFLSGPNNSKR